MRAAVVGPSRRRFLCLDGQHGVGEEARLQVQLADPLLNGARLDGDGAGRAVQLGPHHLLRLRRLRQSAQVHALPLICGGALNGQTNGHADGQ